jgi:Putative peptidoglycan binding domain
MGTMFDAVDVAAIPKDAQIVAGYVDGNWPTYDDVVAAFPDAAHVSITVTGKPGAMVADCESGDLTPQTAAGWAKAEIDAGRRPCIYYSRSAAPAVSAALAAEGVQLGGVDYWVADWTGTPHVVAGSVATQYADPPKSGGNYDISETVDGWPVATPAPGPAPAPSPEPPTPAPAPPPAPTGGFMPPTLKQGDLSASVKSCQALLGLHAPLKVDGDFGPETLQQVLNFQQVMGLAKDGIVGPQTWTALCTFG